MTTQQTFDNANYQEVSYKDVAGASSAAFFIEKNLAKRESISDDLKNATPELDMKGILGGLTGNRKRDSDALAGNIHAIVDKTLINDVAKRSGV
ncbi:hypothetical protein [Absidia glauca]|uniref:Uncharacterized protein n=1 Tax=Absidia glauca TaxID=4829 RepID=A0A163TLS1_ABSGL|nr:hypothetical protein [Absidia glauca]